MKRLNYLRGLTLLSLLLSQPVHADSEPEFTGTILIGSGAAIYLYGAADSLELPPPENWGSSGVTHSAPLPKPVDVNIELNQQTIVDISKKLSSNQLAILNLDHFDAKPIRNGAVVDSGSKFVMGTKIVLDPKILNGITDEAEKLKRINNSIISQVQVSSIDKWVKRGKFSPKYQLTYGLPSAPNVKYLAPQSLMRRMNVHVSPRAEAGIMIGTWLTAGLVTTLITGEAAHAGESDSELCQMFPVLPGAKGSVAGVANAQQCPQVSGRTDGNPEVPDSAPSVQFMKSRSIPAGQ